ncbi:MAG: thiamine diphosphokinase [Acutalibacteraceae bacterium]
MGVCYIIGAGDADKINIKAERGDYVICADGGYGKALSNEIKPDLTVGDFDSYGKIPNEKSIIVHPAEKDDTDSMLAVKCGLERGYRTFIMYGMLGGRLDHTFANIQLLGFICEHGGKGILVGEKYNVTAVKNDKISFKKENEGML